MPGRREFMGAAAAGLLLPWPARAGSGDERVVNDIHARLNATEVAAVHRPASREALQEVVREAARQDTRLAIAGGRHAMGGQQFLTDGWLIDTRGLTRVLDFDPQAGRVTCEAGIQWPELMAHLEQAQHGRSPQWGIAQKQTGADRLCLGGALAANVHGRGLTMKPIVDDVEAFVLIDPDGEALRCARDENQELFRLAIGGYGLFGAIAEVTLRLTRRRKVERVVDIATSDELMPMLDERIASGFTYGDFQFSTDREGDTFLRSGVLSCYRPVDDQTPIEDGQRALSGDDWRRLLHLGHADRARAYDLYTSYYLSSSGQIYWSDSHQLSTYIDDYHVEIDRAVGRTTPGSEMITEIYVPRPALARFFDDVRSDFRAHDVELIYGTVRLIERDDESFLAWAREPWACTIFNLHVDHSPAGLARSAADFRRLIDRALEHGGAYYLTYHRFATPEQVTACHPRFVEFLRHKRRLDPDERFQSDWYRHYRAMFEQAL